MITKSWNSRCWQLGLAGFLAALETAGVGVGDSLRGSFASRAFAQSQIVRDDTLLTPQADERSVVIPNFRGLPVEAIGGGAIRGANLFHSFQEFNVSAGRGAYFFSPNVQIQNILARVTGSNRSEILGTIGTFGYSKPNLFLINPNGIIFGPKASLDVGGSFVATTANAVQLGNTGTFSATEPNSSNLLSVNPSALFFNAVANQGIVNRSTATTTVLGAPTTGLQVPNGRSLLLAGGNVQLDGGELQALGGQVELGGLAGAGTVGLNVDDNNLSLSFPDSAARADVSLTNQAFVFVAAAGGGSITVNAQNIDIKGESSLASGVEPDPSSLGSRAGDIVLNAIGVVTISDSSNIIDFGTLNSTGDSGDIKINAEKINITNGSRISTSTVGSGNAGSITFQVKDKVSLSGVSTNGNFNAVISNEGASLLGGTGNGKGGDINIQARSLSLADGTLVSSETSGGGRAGNIIVDAADSVSVTGGSMLRALTSGRGEAGRIYIHTNTFNISNSGQLNAQTSGTGTGGNITVNANTFQATKGAQLQANTLGQGNAGNINIQAGNTVSFDGVNNSGNPSGAFTGVGAGVSGKGGDITIATGSLSLTNGAQLQARTLGQGNAGNINIQAGNTVSFDGVNNSGNPSGAFTNVESGASGNGGDITITAGSLSLTNGAQLQARTLGQGNSSNVRVRATNAVNIFGTGASKNESGVFTSTSSMGQGGTITVDTNTFNISNGGMLNAQTSGTGAGGSITVNANTFQATKGAELRAGTFGQGNAGNINIQAGNTVSFDGVDSYGNLSGAFTNVESGASGKGGNITITTGSLSLSNEAQVSAQSQGTGTAGNININTRQTLSANNGNITTAAAQSSGGAIGITARNIHLYGNSDITTNVANGAGGGGNINLTANSILAFDDSDILSFSRDGRGGNITLNTPAFFGSSYRPSPPGTDPRTLNGNSRVDINASGNVSGVITLPNVSVIQNSLTKLPANLIDTSTVLANSCIARSNRKGGSFQITGAGGLPNRPGDASVSPYPTGTVRPIPSSGAFRETPQSSVLETNSAQPWKLGDPIVEPQGVYRLASGQLVLSRECSQ